MQSEDYKMGVGGCVCQDGKDNDIELCVHACVCVRVCRGDKKRGDISH